MVLKILFVCLFFILSTASVYVLVRFYNDILKTSNEIDIMKEDFDNLPTKKPVEISTMKAAVLCSPNKKFDYKKYDYKGQKDCILFKKFYDNPTLCSFQCLGFGTCRNFCSENAILIKNNTAVVTSLCIGCGKCVDVCPMHCIKLFPISEYPEKNSLDLCSNEELSFDNCSRRGS